MSRLLTALGLSLIIAAPLAAQDLRVANRINVSAIPDGFVVDGGGGFGARGLWCAAATYAQKVLGAGSAQRIYVAPGSSVNRGVYTLNPAGLTLNNTLILGKSVRTPGSNLTVGHAIHFCTDFYSARSR